MNLIWFILVGATAGFLAGKMMKGRGFGAVKNILVGVAGAIIGGFLFSIIGISTGGGLIGSLITALAGSVVLLYVGGLIQKKK